MLFLQNAAHGIVYEPWSARLEYNFVHDARLAIRAGMTSVERAMVRVRRWQVLNSRECRSLIEFDLKGLRLFPSSSGPGSLYEDLVPPVWLALHVCDFGSRRFQKDTSGVLKNLDCAGSCVYFLPRDLVGMRRDMAGVLVDNFLFSSSEYQHHLSSPDVSLDQRRRSADRWGIRDHPPTVADVRLTQYMCDDVTARHKMRVPDYLMRFFPSFYDSSTAMFREGVLPCVRPNGACVFVVFENYLQMLVCVACDAVHFVPVQHSHRWSVVESVVPMARYEGESADVLVCDGGSDGSPSCAGHRVVNMPPVIKEAIMHALEYLYSAQ